VSDALPLRTELVRAYQRLFGTRGGFTPAAFKEVMPVQIMDESPWPAARRFVLSSQIAGLAANNSGVVIRNSDPLDSGSLISIDSIDILVGVAISDLLLTMHDLGSIALLSGPFNPVDVAPAPPGRAAISNVSYGNFQQVPAATTGYRYFGVPGSPSHFTVPPQAPRWTISPQQELALWCSVVNTQISFTVGGRYYSGL
jgi:hypothetical protein